MVASTHAGAVRAGTLAAARLHMDLGLKEKAEAQGGGIDVFAAIQKIDLPLLLRPLKGLLGAFIDDPSPGVLVTTQRPMSVQRFTAAHELGHFVLGHEPSLDDDNILRRMPTSASPAPNFQEAEANAFAAEFLMPRWLVLSHAARQGWKAADLRRPDHVYQLALRLGVSYEAACWTLATHKLITTGQSNALVVTQPRELKVGLLEPFRPQDYRADVWLLTEKDAGSRIDGSRNDHFVLRLEEHSGGGYLWDIDQLTESGFVVVGDELRALDDGIGGPVVRRVTATPPDFFKGRIELDERRPWEPDISIAKLNLNFDLTGPEEEGLSRAERRILLEAA